MGHWQRFPISDTRPTNDPNIRWWWDFGSSYFSYGIGIQWWRNEHYGYTRGYEGYVYLLFWTFHFWWKTKEIKDDDGKWQKLSDET